VAEAEMEAEVGIGSRDSRGGTLEVEVEVAVKTVRTCQNLLAQNGTCLGLLLLYVGPNGDGFGGQAFMEHYSIFKMFVKGFTLEFFPSITTENHYHGITLDFDPGFIFFVIVEALGLFTIEIDMLLMAGKVLV
jgi:hypothetical protein